jgi:hypothetical protein
VVNLPSGEDDLGAMLAGAIVVVKVVRDVAVRQAIGVDGMPTVPWKKYKLNQN